MAAKGKPTLAPASSAVFEEIDLAAARSAANTKAGQLVIP
jgi:hypothetical protein